jgi:hypothetical protein
VKDGRRERKRELQPDLTAGEERTRERKRCGPVETALVKKVDGRLGKRERERERIWEGK